jgi:NAD(P)-dependent dehydrogenase (short-subunit alcohol dehydrogenase family)
LAICQTLISTFPKSLVLYAASRAGADLGLQPPREDIQIRYAKLSLTNDSSIAGLTKTIEEQHGHCDVLINNAGVYYYKENITPAQRKETLDVNYRGTLKASRSLRYPVDIVICSPAQTLMHDNRCARPSSRSWQILAASSTSHRSQVC